MPGFTPVQTNYKARNANSVIIMIGSQPVGFAQTAPHKFSFGTEQLYGIGSALPQEIQQLKISPQITVDAFALTTAGLLALGILPTSPLSSILANNQFNMRIIDGQTNAALFTYVGAQAGDFSEQITANQVVTDSITFLALDVLDETGNSILNSGQNAFSITSLIGAAINGLGAAITG
jgi:hypothetical protein